MAREPGHRAGLLSMGAQDLAALAEAYDLSDGDVCDLAELLAGQVRKQAESLLAGPGGEKAVASALRTIAKRHGVKQPERPTLAERLVRMSDAGWWRKALRLRLRLVEQHARNRGEVHRRASAYVTGKAMRRHERSARRLAELLASLEAMNLDTGEVMPMDEVVARSQANPVNRRKAMMARIAGIERHALARGDVPLFLTITTPSRMHARYETGARVAAYDGTSPREAHAHLHRTWRLAMRAADRAGLRRCGLRIVEPHHDGCPHWHVLTFTPPSDAEPLLRILRDHALAEAPDEPGAQERRFKAERIDPAKGSAVGYVAKYIAKSIDGEGLDDDTESDTRGADTAKRVVAWSRTWGIRQFQFFGLPPITPCRELHRLDGASLEGASVQAAHAAVKANDYAAFLSACEAYAMAFEVRYLDRPSARYHGEVTSAIHGLLASAADLLAPLSLTTRTEKWVIQPRGGERGDGPAAPTWTRINNCARPDGSTTYETPSGGRIGADARRPKPEAAAPPRPASGGPPKRPARHNQEAEATC